MFVWSQRKFITSLTLTTSSLLFTFIMFKALWGIVSTFQPVVPMQIRTAVSKRKLSKKEYFVYKPKMKSRYLGNPNPRLTMILTEDVNKIGFKGDVVKVKRGIGRHVLIPNKLAIYGTEENLVNNGYDPKKIKEETTAKVPMNVVAYLKKHVIKLTVPENEEAHEATKDLWFITRHDLSEYFWRHALLHVPMNKIVIKDVSDNIIQEVGDYTIEITINNILTVPVPLQVSVKEVEEE